MLRFACPRIAAAVLFVCLGSTSQVAAQDGPSLSQRLPAAAIALPTPPPSLAQFALPTQIEAAVPQQRPAALLGLYLSFGALQALDAHSTSRALSRGAVEANPMMKGIAGSEVGMLAVKAAGTAGVIYATERMWKRNKAAAVIFMVGANSAMIWVVQHNYRAGR